MLTNHDIICKSVINIADKLTHLHAGKTNYAQGGSSRRAFGGGGSETKMIEEEKFGPIAAESSKVAVDVSQGILMEALKKFMFACHPGDHAICCKTESNQEMVEESKQ